MKPESISEKMMFNTVRLETESGMGTGFFYNFQVGDATYPTIIEYSCAVTPQVRQTGNRLSGLAGTAYASLLT